MQVRHIRAVFVQNMPMMNIAMFLFLEIWVQFNLLNDHIFENISHN